MVFHQYFLVRVASKGTTTCFFQYNNPYFTSKLGFVSMFDSKLPIVATVLDLSCQLFLLFVRILA